MRKLDVVYRTKGGDGVGIYGDVLLTAYVSPSSDATLDELIPVFESSPRTKAYGLLVTISGVVRPPGEAIRPRILGLLNRTDTIAALAMVLLGTGFASAGHRAAVLRIRNALRPPYPTDVFTDIPSSAQWLARHVPDHTPEEIAGAATVMSALRPRVPRGVKEG